MSVICTSIDDHGRPWLPQGRPPWGVSTGAVAGGHVLIPQPLAVLRIDRGYAAADRLERETELVGHLSNKRIRAGQIMRHHAGRPCNFPNRLAWFGRHLDGWVIHPGLAAQVRLLEVNRIVEDHRDCQLVAVAVE